MKSKNIKSIEVFSKAGIEGAKVLVETGSLKSSAIAAGHNIIQNVVDTGSDYLQRELSEIESDRITRTLEIIRSGISAQIASGRKPNCDFYIHDGKGRVPSIEICEGVLQKCKLEYEENKLPYIAKIFVNAPFMDDYSKEEIFYRMMIAEKLTYRQLCILSIAGNSDKVDRLSRNNYVKGYKDSKLRALLTEIADLNYKGLVQDYNRQNNRAYSLSGILSITPYNLKLTKDGLRQYELMDLSLIDDEHINKIEAMLT